MALRKKGKYSYGDSQADIREELLSYSQANGYPAVHFANAVCVCGSQVFNLFLDDTEGAAVRICTNCAVKYPIGDSQEYLEGAELEECECPCGAGDFEITAGVALFEESEDVKWLYLGCRCCKCGLTACYGDWKNEYEGYQEFLKLI